jgi:antitoxin HigA-1
MRLASYFGVDPQFWLNLQSRYDLMMLQDRRSEIEREMHPLERRCHQ